MERGSPVRGGEGGKGGGEGVVVRRKKTLLERGGLVGVVVRRWIKNDFISWRM